MAQHIISGVKISTNEQLPACWVATNDNYDGPGSPIGTGTSEREAIDDLLLQMFDETAFCGSYHFGG